MGLDSLPALLVGDGLLVMILDEEGVIHQTVWEEMELDGREQLELDQAIALSLADSDSPRMNQSRSLSDLSSASQIDQVRRKAPPPILARPEASESRPRPAVVSLAAPPEEPVPPPPGNEPTAIQRQQARARFANLPTLFPPTGSAWASSPLARPKAPPPPAPMPAEFLRIPSIERWYFFPTVARDPLIRRTEALPRGSSDSVRESDSSEGDDVTSTHSTAPSITQSDWD